MSPDFIFIYILIIHYMADFGLQTIYQAQNKGVGDELFNQALFFHVGVYSLIWLIATIPILNHGRFIPFAFITFFCHYIIDYTTSRVGKPFWSSGDYHNGFNVVGFDQILHYLQLWYTFKLLI